MRGSYQLRDWETDHLKKIIPKFIEDLELGRKQKIDLTNYDAVCPANFEDILPQLGWTWETEEDNYHDFWWYYTKGNKKLILSLDVMTMELILTMENVEDNI